MPDFTVISETNRPSLRDHLNRAFVAAQFSEEGLHLDPDCHKMVIFYADLYAKERKVEHLELFLLYAAKAERLDNEAEDAAKERKLAAKEEEERLWNEIEERNAEYLRRNHSISSLH